MSDPSLMKALVFRGKCSIALEDVPRPTIQADTDVIVSISLCGLCGSDMHPYHCREKGLDHGTVCGHEFVGTVHEVGPKVMKFKLGELVMSPFTTSCGGCFYCARGLTARCECSQLFGWVEQGHGLHGAQAQFVRVPLADSTLVAVPAGISIEQALLLGDVFSTGFYSAENAGIQDYAANDPNGAGPVVAVVGCGPVGLIAVMAARHLGASTVLAIDSVPERLQLGQKFGTDVVDRSACDAVHAVREKTGGRGADVVLEAVGLPPAFELAFELVRPGGVVSVAGCHAEAAAPLSMVYNKNLKIMSGRCSARHFMDKLLPLVQENKFDLEAIITHRLPLSPEAYTLFDSRKDGVIKVVMDPWTER